MKNVIKLDIKNFMGIKQVEMTAQGVNVIHGQNNQSKTSIIKAINFAIYGDSDKNLVRMGTDEADVMIELGDVSIRRRLNSAERQILDVRCGKEKIKKPQEYLDKQFSLTAFNPIEILDPKKRNEYILKTIDVRITKEELAQQLEEHPDHLPELKYDKHALLVLDEAHDFYYKTRARANKDALEKKNRYEVYRADNPKQDLPIPPDRADIQRAIDQCDIQMDLVRGEIKSIESMEEERAKNSEHRRLAQEKLDGFRNAIKHYQAQKAPAGTVHQEKLAALKVEYDKAVAEEMVRYKEVITAIDAEIKTLEARTLDGEKYLSDLDQKQPIEVPDKSALHEKLATIQAGRVVAEAKFKELDAYEAVQKTEKIIADMAREQAVAEEMAAILTRKVDALAGPIKRELMSKVEMPVPGLEYNEGTFFIDGVSVDNLSTSRAMKFAIRLAQKLSGPTKIICIDGSEALDAATREEFFNEIKDDGFLYFFTVVGDAVPLEHVNNFEMKDGALVGHEPELSSSPQ
ncbi:AAA family ATPase [Bdellovibrio bacteriovorus]|uniref:AAA family ATPase n=1 Tax=Bdellovibrio bacteriovorus TaxID=959 RepID=UPI003AA8C728